MRSSIALLSFAAVALAESQIPFFYPGITEASDPGADPHVSIVSANAATTAMKLGCPKATPACGWVGGPTMSVISGSIYKAQTSSIPGDAAFSMSMECTSNKAVTCTLALPMEVESVSGVDMSELQNAMTVTTTYSKDIIMQTATVTAGEEKLKATAGASGTAAAPNNSGLSAASGSQTAPAQSTSTGAANVFGVKAAAVFGIAGAAAAQLF